MKSGNVIDIVFVHVLRKHFNFEGFIGSLKHKVYHILYAELFLLIQSYSKYNLKTIPYPIGKYGSFQWCNLNSRPKLSDSSNRRLPVPGP